MRCKNSTKFGNTEGNDGIVACDATLTLQPK